LSEIKPIRSEADYEAALAEIETLWGARLGTLEGDRLDVLATLIDAYEAEHHAIDPPDPIEAIKFRMEQQGLARKDLEGLLGTRTRVAEVLKRRRGLSINMIRRLHDELGIAAEILIRPCGTPIQPIASEVKTVPPIRQLVYDAVSAQFRSREFTRQDVIRSIKNIYTELNDASVLPSDYLCADALKADSSNAGNQNNFWTYPRFLERIGRNRYIFVGWDGIAEGSLNAPISRTSSRRAAR
jgi:HTH-type transcriptional regulator / antitoxin HigA